MLMFVESGRSQRYMMLTLLLLLLLLFIIINIFIDWFGVLRVLKKNETPNKQQKT